MRELHWCSDSFNLGKNEYSSDFCYNVTKDIYKKNPFVRITDLYIDNDDFLYVYYEFLVDVKNSEKIVDKKLKAKVEKDIKESIKNYTY